MLSMSARMRSVLVRRASFASSRSLRSRTVMTTAATSGSSSRLLETTSTGA